MIAWLRRLLLAWQQEELDRQLERERFLAAAHDVREAYLAGYAAGLRDGHATR